MKERIFPILTILAAGVLAYLCALQVGFLPIDDVGMTEFVTQQTLDLKSLLFGGASTYYRPMVVISYVANYSIFGLPPLSFHAVNVVIHLANALLIYWLASLFFADHPQKERAALIASLFFLLNPLNSEAVIWVSARPDLLCTFFFILAMVLLVERREQVTWQTLFCFTAAYLASLASKESSIAVAAIVPLYLLRRAPREGKRDALMLFGAVAGTTTLYLLLRAGTALNFDRGVASLAKGVLSKGGVEKVPKAMEGTAAAAATAAQSYTYPTVLDALGGYGFYLRKLVFPFPLNFTILTYDLPLGLAACALAVAAAWVLMRRRPQALLPLLIVFVGIIPPLLAYLGRIPWTPFGERYLYLPMVGFSLLVPLVLLEFKVPAWLLLGGVLLLGIPTINRAALWRDPTAFWQDCLKHSPGFAKSYSSLGAVALDDQRYDDAERYIRKAQALGFNEPVAWKNLARVYLARKDYPRYEQAMQQAANHSRNPIPVYHEMVLALMGARGLDEATRFQKGIKYHLATIESDPGYLDAYYNVGKLYYAQGDAEHARRYLGRYAELAKGGENRVFALKMIANLDSGSFKSRKALVAPPAVRQGGEK
ncbi:hypothetical protein KP003_07280 [Geomonas nitrogeniifigens]|uniref:Tetratricopeptide repeat protein n=1 Tax=Geomonas diazotrophica TaxID=2843197 RepID=A0ABX8JMX9_9BACT|nr:hypothetical protein [Geomonas nitrogeniifigens]QWV99029.1 hypothetical protein KP005_07030 [Geomonas nitrogeniifigens]QXE88195.1 hypothetical protein KP003_07280 [Geomonas nitrogeniifigens]